MDQVRQNLLVMKPALIVQTVTKSMQEQLQQLRAENQELKQRLAQLETIVDKHGENDYE